MKSETYDVFFRQTCEIWRLPTCRSIRLKIDPVWKYSEKVLCKVEIAHN